MVEGLASHTHCCQLKHDLRSPCREQHIQDSAEHPATAHGERALSATAHGASALGSAKQGLLDDTTTGQ